MVGTWVDYQLFKELHYMHHRRSSISLMAFRMIWHPLALVQSNLHNSNVLLGAYGRVIFEPCDHTV